MDRVAKGRRMSFSAIKTDWMGFSGGWEGIELGSVRKKRVDVLRCLGFFFNVAGDFSSHVECWTKRALDVRRRISAVGRWFGSIGRVGAWEMWRLITAVLIPTVGYCAEFTGGDAKSVSTMPIHTNDCIRPCFRAPLNTANNIVLGEAGIPPWIIQLRYIRRWCYLRMISYRYGDNLPWFGCVRKSWGERGVVPVRTWSEKVLLRGPPLCDISKDKFDAVEMHDQTS